MNVLHILSHKDKAAGEQIMSYSRKIAYFDLLEEGQKKGNAGFCKWEERNGKSRLTVLVNGLPKTLSKSVALYTAQGRELGNIQISDGKGNGVCYLQDGYDWRQELERILIPLQKGMELTAEFSRKSDTTEHKEVSLKEGQKESLSAAEDFLNEKEKAVLPAVEDFLKETSQITAEETKTVLQEPAEDLMKKEPEPISFAERLEKTYQKVYPFGTDEEYFKIEAEDIYSLKKEYHMLRNNQFLLHGYYNYHYLILGKKKAGQPGYWLGVPGIYHEREKMAARMYGFEKFEGARPGYQTGDLGYYLITAEA